MVLYDKDQHYKIKSIITHYKPSCPLLMIRCFEEDDNTELVSLSVIINEGFIGIAFIILCWVKPQVLLYFPMQRCPYFQMIHSIVDCFFFFKQWSKHTDWKSHLSVRWWAMRMRITWAGRQWRNSLLSDSMSLEWRRQERSDWLIWFIRSAC